MNIGQRLYVARIKKGITQKKLSAETGISQANICNLERDRRDITMATFLRVCYALGVKPHEVFLEAGRREPPLVWTRERVERMANYIVCGTGRLSGKERRVADLVKSALPENGRKLSAKRIQLNWLELRELASPKEIDFLCGRVRDARQRNQKNP